MEHANRAEAETCLQKAREALKAGDTPRAQRMLDKAQRLDPSDLTKSEHSHIY